MAVDFRFVKPFTAELDDAPINFLKPGENVVIPASDQRIRVFKLFLTVSGPCNLTFQDTGGRALTGPMAFAANGGIALDLDAEPWFVTKAGSGFAINSDSNVQVSGTVYYQGV